MFKENFSISKEVIRSREALVIGGLGYYSLKDTFECGQCFRYEQITEDENYVEYIMTVGENIINVAQEKRGELIFYGADEQLIEEVIRPYFTIDTDYEKIRADILAHTNCPWLKKAAESAKGIAILKQDAWETLFSFIISQNNNIPRIRKIIREMSAAYGVNICLQKNIQKCPLKKIDGTPCEEKCSTCGICYTFPKAKDIVENPEKMLPSHPGFRYRYLLDAAERVADGRTNLEKIAAARSYTHTVSCLCEIVGVGEKVASCTALFGFANLEAFPIDVWMKRAINDYFDGELDPLTLGRYAGVAQQYIFHYIRNLKSQENSKTK